MGGTRFELPDDAMDEGPAFLPSLPLTFPLFPPLPPWTDGALDAGVVRPDAELALPRVFVFELERETMGDGNAELGSDLSSRFLARAADDS